LSKAYLQDNKSASRPKVQVTLNCSVYKIDFRKPATSNDSNANASEQNAKAPDQKQAPPKVPDQNEKK